MASRADSYSAVLVLGESPEERAALAALVEAQGLEAVAARDVADALRLVRFRRADVLLASVPPDVHQALGLVMAMKETDPALEVIVLASFERPEDGLWLLRQGHAFDVLRPPPHDLPAVALSLDVALRRRARLLEALRDRVPAGAAVPPPPSPLPGPDRVVLTARETDTLRLVAHGLENRDIARKLVVSENTVRNNLARIYSKLGAGNRTQAVAIARRLRVL